MTRSWRMSFLKDYLLPRIFQLINHRRCQDASRTLATHLFKQHDVDNIGDITCPCVDMNFIFECSTRYLTRSQRSLVRYRVDHERIKFISISEYVIFCWLYKHQWNTKSACFQRRDLLRNHNDGDLLRVKITCCLHVWKYEVFAGKLT